MAHFPQRLNAAGWESTICSACLQPRWSPSCSFNRLLQTQGDPPSFWELCSPLRGLNHLFLPLMVPYSPWSQNSTIPQPNLTNLPPPRTPSHGSLLENRPASPSWDDHGSEHPGLPLETLSSLPFLGPIVGEPIWSSASHT